MWTPLHWVTGPWPGKLAHAARPRGPWLSDRPRDGRTSRLDRALRCGIGCIRLVNRDLWRSFHPESKLRDDKELSYDRP